MRVLAIDPGTTDSAFVLFDGARVLEHGQLENAALKARIKARAFGGGEWRAVFEEIENMGMPAGREVFKTVQWTGRFMEAAGDDRWDLVTRRAVKLHLCGDMRAKDANVRQSLIDRFGGSAAIKKAGPLHGVGSHRWSALAVAVTWWDTKREQ